MIVSAPTLGSYDHVYRIDRQGGVRSLLTPFGNPNHLAGFCGLGSTVALGLMLTAGNRRNGHRAQHGKEHQRHLLHQVEVQQPQRHSSM